MANTEVILPIKYARLTIPDLIANTLEAMKVQMNLSEIFMTELNAHNILDQVTKVGYNKIRPLQMSECIIYSILITKLETSKK